MALKDYESLDEEDFYGQDFERPGIVSVWGSDEPLSALPHGVDILQDLCGIGYYDLDNNELVGESVSPAQIADELSYSNSFRVPLLEAIRSAAISPVWLAAQYDFDYVPSMVKREVSGKVVFLGSFQYDRS